MTRMQSAADAKKTARSLAKTYGNATTNRNDSHMMALAFSLARPDEHKFAYSGHVRDVSTPVAPYAAYLELFKDTLPWNGLQPAENRPFENCAEAHLWLELRARAKNPRDYYETSFTGKGNLSAPCRNCEQWVFRAFGHVFTPSAHYAGHPKQRP